MATGSKDSHYRAIGEFLVEYSLLEYFLKICFSLAVGAEEDAFDAVTVQPMRSMVSGLIELSERRYGSDKAKAFIDLLNKVNSLADDRNHIAHAYWEQQENGLVDSYLSNRGKRSQKFSDVAMIQARADTARELGGKLIDGYLTLITPDSKS